MISQIIVRAYLSAHVLESQLAYLARKLILASSTACRKFVKLAKGIYDEDQFSNIEMILLQALNGYNIKDKEGEEVDVLDIASD